MGDSEDPFLQAGSVFAGRYKILRPLGEGDRKRTYLAEDILLPRRVAVALIKSTAAQIDPQGSRREAEALAKAGTHDNVVTFHDWGVVEGAEYLVFDYLAGGTLRDYLAKRNKRGNPLSAEGVMLLGRQLSRALSHVHGLGLIHRDLAPGNVWLDERQMAHLGDFDSAVGLDAALDPSNLPPTTEAYSAPEQIAGGHFDQRSDLYSLGAVLFEALTGERPARVPRVAVADRLRALRPDIPRSLGQTVSWLLAESPADRPTTADEVLVALKPGRVYRTVEEGLIPWADTLPFPLASILWHYDGDPDPAVKIDYLLKFFEALAQLVATIQLSACISDRAFSEANSSTWFATSDARPLGLGVASFGTWVKLSERLGLNVRELLQNEAGANYCRDLFMAANLEMVEALASVELAGIFQHALDRRNSWSGHGGVAGQIVHRERLGDLEDLLGRTRALVGWSFEEWTLLKPGPMTCSQGIYELTATILKGPNPAFRRKQIRLTEALDAAYLYMLNDGNLRALRLAPFIRVLAGKTGQDACYFYSRLEGTGVRWVSYHFHAEPELVLPDDGLADLLATLGSKDSVAPISRPRSSFERAPDGTPTRGTRQSEIKRPLYEHCQRCGYPFGKPLAQQFCKVRAACDRRIREPGYRVPEGRTQDLAIRDATIAMHPGQRAQ
jgi:serine/threonine protein kinase